MPCIRTGPYPLFRRIGVIKSNDELSVVHLSEILIQDGSLGVTDVQVTTGLRGEARNNLPIYRILKTKSKSSSSFV